MGKSPKENDPISSGRAQQLADNGDDTLASHEVSTIVQEGEIA